MFDLIVLIVVGLLTLRGLWEGLVRQVIGLAGAIAGYVIAMKYSEPLAAKFLTGFRLFTGHVIAFVVIFIVCIIVASLLARIAGKLLSLAGLGILNRLGGGLLGFLKGCFIFAVLTMLLVAFLSPDSSFLKGPGTLKYLQPMAEMVSDYAPKSVKIKYDENARKMARPKASPEKKARRGHQP